MSALCGGGDMSPGDGLADDDSAPQVDCGGRHVALRESGDVSPHSKALPFVVALLVFSLLAPASLPAQDTVRLGDGIPPEVETVYERGLGYLASSQHEHGGWRGRNENGVTGLCLMAFLASGEDPNFGRWRRNIRLAVRSLLREQESDTGYFPNSMYHHGFAMLALAEVYGVLDESTLWKDGAEDSAEDGESEAPPSIAFALEQAIALAAEAQRKNRWGGWRYTPAATDADTSVTGAVLMGLLACRNAGLAVPDEVVDNAVGYLKRNTASSGFVAYTGGLGGGGESMARSAVATLVYAVGGEKESEEYANTLRHITDRLDHNETGHRHYFYYYMAQALFQGDYEAWREWNGNTARLMAENQAEDGSFSGSYGEAYCTAASLLSLALNYRFLPIYERF